MNRQISQEQVWNKIAEPWGVYRKKAPEEVVEFLNNKSGKILDLGCGGGRNIIPKTDAKYYCIDFSDKMLEYAKEEAKKDNVKAKFFKIDMGKEKLPFEDNFFDYALFISTLHCIEGEENRNNALKEMYRTMKKGGKALITVWNKEGNEQLKDIRAKEGFVNWQKDGKNYKRYYYFYDENELKKILEEIGFRIIKIKQGKEDTSKFSKKNIVVYVKK